MRGRRHIGIALVLMGLLTVSSVAALAAGTGDDQLRQLIVENRAAQLLADLELTPEQTTQLKGVVQALVDQRDAARSQLVSVLQERKAALLSGDEDAIAAANEKLSQLRTSQMEQVKATVSDFAAGLTQKQKELLGRVLPGSGPAGRAPGKTMPRQGPQSMTGPGQGGPMWQSAPADRSPQQMRERMGDRRGDFDRPRVAPNVHGKKGAAPHMGAGRAMGPMPGHGGNALDALLSVLNETA